MRKARRVRNNRIRDEGRTRQRIRLNTRIPAPIHHLRNHRTLTLNLPRSQRLHARYQAGVLDHVRHQLRGISPDGVEFQIGVPDEGLELPVRGEAHAVTALLQFIAQRDEGLHVASTADDLDHDVELDGPGRVGSFFGRGGGNRSSMREEEDFGEASGELGV